jgi:tetrahydromethanopterin S-methyltransferase subunit E
VSVRRWILSVVFVSCLSLPLMLVFVTWLGLPNDSPLGGLIGIATGVITLLIGIMVWARWEVRALH